MKKFSTYLKNSRSDCSFLSENKRLQGALGMRPPHSTEKIKGFHFDSESL